MLCKKYHTKTSGALYFTTSLLVLPAPSTSDLPLPPLCFLPFLVCFLPFPPFLSGLGTGADAGTGDCSGVGAGVGTRDGSGVGVGVGAAVDDVDPGTCEST